MSKPNKKILATGAVMVGLSSFVPNPFTTEAMAQPTATGAVTVSASISNPLNISESSPLNWGVFAVAGAGDIAVGPTGPTQVMSKGVGITAGTVGKVALNAPQGATFSLTIPDFAGATGKLTLKTGGAANTLTVTTLKLLGTAKFTKGGVAATGAYQANKEDEGGFKIKTGTAGVFTYGGTMTFLATQAVGTYNGTFQMVQTF